MQFRAIAPYSCVPRSESVNVKSLRRKILRLEGEIKSLKGSYVSESEVSRKLQFNKRITYKSAEIENYRMQLIICKAADERSMRREECEDILANTVKNIDELI